MKSFKNMMNRIPRLKKADEGEGGGSSGSSGSLPAATGASQPLDASSLTKDDLLHLSTKLSKRLKAIEAKNIKLKEYAKRMKDSFDGAKDVLCKVTGLEPVALTTADGSFALPTIEAALQYKEEQQGKAATDRQQQEFAQEKRKLQQRIQELERQQSEAKADAAASATVHSTSTASRASTASDDDAEQRRIVEEEAAELRAENERLRMQLETTKVRPGSLFHPLAPFRCDPLE